MRLDIVENLPRFMVHVATTYEIGDSDKREDYEQVEQFHCYPFQEQKAMGRATANGRFTTVSKARPNREIQSHAP